MKLLRILIVIGLLVGAGVAAYKPAAKYWKKRNKPEWRTAKVVQGDITSVVNSTGTVQPVLRVQVGSFVSGPILELNVDFNQEVKEGELMAKIDPQLYDAAVQRDMAVLKTREADVERAKAQLQQAKNDETRAKNLREENEGFISDAEMDQFKFARMALEAQVAVAEASISQAEASLQNSKTNLEYTNIRAPVDGIVIDRKIDRGQTLAAQFQTPELFVVAPDMRKEMHIFASVDEADIGMIRDAQEAGQPVQFTVDAYPDDLFEGVIAEVRFSSTTTQNVVTYPVVVSAPNPDLKLLPGMTASISFQVDQREKVQKIPNAALRFFPDAKQVREKDRSLLEGDLRDDDEDEQAMTSAQDRAAAREKRNRRHIWVVDGDLLKAIEVQTGLSDNRHTELVSGEVEDEQEVVIGIKPK